MIRVWVVLSLATVLVLANESVIPTKSEYERYLDQVLLVFSNDPNVVALLKNATPEDIKNGVIEKTLRRINPQIRSRLDEVKRNIIMEYRQKLRKAKMDDNVPEELYTFTHDDLKHLLNERQERLKQMDDQRRKEFKKFEMEKELKHRMALRAMNEYDRKVQEALDEEGKAKKKEKSNQIKHPGNKEQLQDVWEAEGFDRETFNPATFFKMHDMNGDDEWDLFELEAIFEKEVEDLFEGLPDVDEDEKYEEVARMREHVVQHMDQNGDGFIQLSEFLEYAKGKEFDHSDPWETVFEDQLFNEDELAEFEKKLDSSEQKELEDLAKKEALTREEKIAKYEAESKLNMDMLKEHSEKLKEAIMAANKFKELEKAKKIVAANAAAQQQPAGQNQIEEELKREQERLVDDQRRQIEEQQRLEQQRQIEEQQRLEQQRQIEEQQRLEQQRQIEEQQRLEQQRQIEEQQRLEQQRQIEEQQRLEQQRQIEEQQRLEQQRQIEEQQRLEQQRQLEEQQRLEQQRQIEEQQRLEQQRQIEEQQRLAQQQQQQQQQQQ